MDPTHHTVTWDEIDGDINPPTVVNSFILYLCVYVLNLFIYY